MSSLNDYERIAAGKVREIYSVDPDTLLMVVSDRISVFDYILDTPIPDKGKILTGMSKFFFDTIDFPNHLAGELDDERIPREARGRAMLVKKLDMVPFECVARGYLTGSALKEYRQTGTVCGIELPEGLTEASKLPEPIFTPATKAELGDHDENVSFEYMVDKLGRESAEQLRDATLSIYSQAAAIAEKAGIILVDTKFEFGRDENGQLVLADEVLTPDSSRYWPANKYQEGQPQPSFDKQYVRDWVAANTTDWDNIPSLPQEVVAATRALYVDAYEKITGQSFEDYLNQLAS
ncbi:phosphoribosylaminoimidazolesuccinocarboxamide synthase [Corynebacterium aquilae]|uniref:Phosphoribosylaminoimidazole-succinocarboxamide synthase n=1 Tax=Corynebacterium aquilae DSM 44791 TaxID=1431546 RepID=A0A1L7CI53_9CORY|nr:phosphoribosylaminoimidazolesuccinocarboxamide synthase [Corynebacterium aquilae]APT85443.1 phosphoribosylaminoimidazole-succinocarboxamide synthase [Corynebacterium aquilae DSM 44791]